MSDSLVRVEFDIDNEAAQAFDALAKRCEFVTRVELLENMCGLFEWAVEQAERGRAIAGLDEKEMVFNKALLPVLVDLANKRKSA